MKNLLLNFSFALSVGLFQACSQHQEEISSLAYTPESTIASIEDSTIKSKKATKPKRDPSKTKYGIDKSSTVPGEAGSGSGVGDGGSISGADTMKIMR